MNNNKFPLEIKYLGRGKKVDLFISILIIITGIILPVYLLLHIGDTHILEGGNNSEIFGFFMVIIALPIMLILFGLMNWHVWPRFIRFSSDRLTFVDARTGPLFRIKPYEVKWEDIVCIETEFNNDLLLVYSKELKDEQVPHKDIDLTGLTDSQTSKILKILKGQNVSIGKSSRISLSDAIEKLDGK
jgi:hypothetical protein